MGLPAPPQKEVNGHRTIRIFLILLLQSFQTVSGAGIALLLSEIRSDLGLSFTEAGTLAAANIFSYALLQMPAGYLADRHGLERVFLVGSLGTTLLLLTFGLVGSFAQAIVNQTLAGAFHAFLFQAGLALLANLFGAERRATAMGLTLVGIFSGQLMINGLGPVLAQQFNWRFPFIAFGVAGLLSSLAYLRHGRAIATRVPTQGTNVIEALRLFGHPFMWICGLIQFVRLGIIQGISFWLPSLLIDEKGLGLGTVGLILALRSVLIAPSTIAGGYLSDRLRQPTVIMAVSLVILAGTTAALVPTGPGSLLIGLILLNATFVQFYFGPTFALPVERYGNRMMGTVSGFGNFFANLGAFSFTYLIGALKDQTGRFGLGFYALAAACLAGLLLTGVLEKMRHRTRASD
jgi:predicted MFS family arabinose efflux permease